MHSSAKSYTSGLLYNTIIKIVSFELRFINLEFTYSLGTIKTTDFIGKELKYKLNPFKITPLAVPMFALKEHLIVRFCLIGYHLGHYCH